MRLTDRFLLTLSLATSGIGIILLAVIMTTSTLPSSSITEAKTLADKEPVQLNGTIIALRHAGNTTFLTIEQSCSLQAVSFSTLHLQTGQTIIASGTMDTYNGERELLLETVSLQ